MLLRHKNTECRVDAIVIMPARTHVSQRRAEVRRYDAPPPAAMRNIRMPLFTRHATSPDVATRCACRPPCRPPKPAPFLLPRPDGGDFLPMSRRTNARRRKNAIVRDVAPRHATEYMRRTNARRRESDAPRQPSTPAKPEDAPPYHISWINAFITVDRTTPEYLVDAPDECDATGVRWRHAFFPPEQVLSAVASCESLPFRSSRLLLPSLGSTMRTCLGGFLSWRGTCPSPFRRRQRRIPRWRSMRYCDNYVLPPSLLLSSSSFTRALVSHVFLVIPLSPPMPPNAVGIANASPTLTQEKLRASGSVIPYQ